MAAQLADHDLLSIRVEPFGDVGYRQRPGAVFRYPNGTAATANALGFRGPPLSRAKPEGTTRIVLLGGSTTHGWGVNDDQTIDAHMRRFLADARAGRFEVINGSFDGYDSRQLVERLQHDMLGFDPDIVIVNCGINDVRNARFRGIVDADPRTMLWRAPMAQLRREAANGRSAWTIAKHYSLLLRLPGFVRNQSEGTVRNDGPVPTFPDAADYFEHNLRTLSGIARARGTRLIFSTPPSSLRSRYPADARSHTSYWLANAEATAVYRDTLAARLQRLATVLGREGMTVRYLRPNVPPREFLDDAHLTGAGNAIVARAFTDAVLELTGH